MTVWMALAWGAFNTFFTYLEGNAGISLIAYFVGSTIIGPILPLIIGVIVSAISKKDLTFTITNWFLLFGIGFAALTTLIVTAL